MSYTQYKPDPALSPYIDGYWQVTGGGTKPVTDRIMPDCCIDIIINLGTDVVADGSGLIMKTEKAYLVGTMTRFKDSVREANTQLIGIRFKPGGFVHFYKYGPLHEITDKITEFDKRLAPAINTISQDFANNLNHFFLGRLAPVRLVIFPVLAQIYKRKGQITVVDLAKDNFMTVRTLERLFLQHAGIGPKEFINFVRYQFAIQNIRNGYINKSLTDIAIESGYYDHAHLANEIKKYTGLSPSQL